MKYHTVFFVITFVWSWSLWSVPILLGLPVNHPVTMLLYIFGGIAPSSTGIILARLRGDSYWKIIVDIPDETKYYRTAVQLIIAAIILYTWKKGTKNDYSIYS